MKNRRPVNEAQGEEIRAILKRLANDTSATERKTGGRLTAFDMFRHGYATQTLILMLCWVSGIVTSYALLLNVEGLAGDMFINFCLTMLCDLPAYVFIYAMADRLGRCK